ncbi:HlyD family secretion protein [Catenovulum sp. 2E275]|uniref:HlyD family secretion protein n=1 Tax=Catenovulum sp. 2E275 TaxID=2980497 RepID=UPI0021CF8E5B|nr:HlyD family secretion protein [Catenovulum sp. 2E275]MCU4675689.1 HlyD family secretion protein [Catenovulum sp. 2E275]
MTPDQKFNRYVKISLVGFVLVFVYYIIADIWLPVTPQARVYHPVVQVAPQINGRITQVLVKNHQRVNAGDILFKIDDAPFKLALAQAELALDDAKLTNQQINSQIAAITAQIEAAKAQLNEQKLLKQRAENLIKQQAISQQQRDNILANYKVSKANLLSLQAQLSEAKLKRGAKGENNLTVRHAQNQIAQAKLNLAYTQVRAVSSGVVANLQLTEGLYAKSGQPLLALVSPQIDLIADFREKSLLNMHPGSLAKITFDSRPGAVFNAHISSFEAGVSDGQLTANGLLTETEKSNRWVRDAQRQRIHLQLTDNQADVLNQLQSGARATVQLLPQSSVGQWLGSVQIRFISWLHFIY